MTLSPPRGSPPAAAGRRREPSLSRSASAVRSGIFADLAPRIEARARAGVDLIELHIGDTHREPPPVARFACIEQPSFDAGLYRYGAVAGLDALKEAFVERLAAHGHGPRQIDPGRDVLVACGATHAIFCALRAVLDEGDEVLVAAPYWPLAVGIVRAVGAVPVEVRLTGRSGAESSPDVAATLEAALTPRTRAVYLITPNNPDGRVLSRAELDSVARLAVERGLWVLSDEVYADYVYEGVHTSIAAIDGAEDRTISAYSLSKSHALAGARVGFVVAPERVVAVAKRIAVHTVFNVPVAAQRVALAALRAEPAWVDRARRDYRDARDAVLDALRGSGAAFSTPQGGSYVFVDFAPVLAGRPLHDLLERAIDRGVLVAPGHGFGDGFESWARLCFTSVPRGRLVEGIARLRDALAAL